MSILVVGSVAYDSVETPFGLRERVLGGSATYFSTCASFFSPVNLVAVVGDDFAEEDRQFLQQKGIDLQGLQVAEGKTFHWKGRYRGAMNEAETLDTRLNVFEHFQPSLPGHYAEIPLLFLANIDPDLQSAVLKQMKKPQLSVCDTMNFWIEGKRDSLLDLLRRVDILLINEEEAKELAGQSNLVRAARFIVEELGPSRIVVKRGEYGVLVYGPEGFFGAPAYPVETVKDPTGAGDTFAGGFVGHLAGCPTADENAFRMAVAHGTVMASFTVEDFSLDRLKKLTRADIDNRLAEYLRMVRF